MTAQCLTLNVPTPLYNELKRRAARSHRSVEDETLDLLAGAATAGVKLPDDLEADLEGLKLLDTAALWDEARHVLSAEAIEALETLNRKQQREKLTASEQETVAGLIRQYERVVLMRASAAAVLRERGEDLSEFGIAS